MPANTRNLAFRAEVIRRIRSFFDKQGFLEVETPVRIAAPAPEPHIDCPCSGRAFLRASPELQMKKLIAAGLEKIYQIGPCFREGECGSRHQPEFTMIEWYRAHAGYLDILADMEALVAGILPGLPPTPFPRLSVRDAYRKFAGWDPVAAWDADRFDLDMALKIEPSLPKTPVFLIDYPAPAASLARLKPGNPSVAERWEFYVQGIELANCFSELVDGPVQRARFEAAREERRRCKEADYPLDDEFLDVIGTMPPSGGVALGVDRLVMLAAGADSIAAVRAFSEEPGRIF